MAATTKTPVSVLQELRMKRKYSPLVYTWTPRTVFGTHLNNFEYEVKFCDMTATGSGSSKQIAKQAAAHNALMMLKEAGAYDPKIEPCEQFQAPTLLQPQHHLESCPNCVVPLEEICETHKIPKPEYTLKAETGPAHNKQFTYEYHLINTELTTVETGSTKKLAKQLAAKDMLDKVKAILP